MNTHSIHKILIKWLLFELIECTLESVCNTKRNKRCKFPFWDKKNGKLNFKCPKWTGGAGRTWCALEVDSDRVCKKCTGIGADANKKKTWDTCGEAKRCSGKNKF